MKQGYRGNIDIGQEVRTHALDFGGRTVLETEFLHYDGVLYQLDLKQHGIDEYDYNAVDEFDETGYDRRSVRIFHMVAGEQINLKPGDEVRATIQSFSVDKARAKDGRRKIHIVLTNARRVYRWVRDKKESALSLQLWCGRRKVREHIIPLHSRKIGAVRKDGRVYPATSVVLLPKGSVLSASIAYTDGMSSGDYILRERLRGRTAREIQDDFISAVPAHDRLIPIRNRRHMHKIS